MGHPAIFSGIFTKLLTPRGILKSDGALLEYNGAINYIKNGHAERGTSGWATYADAAGTRPVDGTGGSAVAALWTAPTANAARGAASFLFAKDAANRQGQGVSYDFTIDAADKAKILQISFDYSAIAGTFVAGTSSTDSDVIVYIYDITNDTLIEPSTYKLFSSTSSTYDRFIANFQTSSNSTSYRLIFHCASTSAVVYSLKIANVQVSPTTIAFGTPIRDGKSYTPTFTGLGTVTNASGMWWQFGDRMIGKFSCTAGTVSGTIASVSLPLGAIDTSKLTISANTTANPGEMVGAYENSETIANTAGPMVLAPGTSTNVVYFGYSEVNGASSLTPAPGSNVTASSVVVSGWFEVPIAGWSSQVQTSDVSDQRIVSAVYIGNATSATAGNPLRFDTVAKDTHAAVTTGASWKFTAPLAGLYHVSVAFEQTTTVNGSVYLYKNGSQSYFIDKAATAAGGASSYSGSVVIELSAGDYIHIQETQNMTFSTSNFNTISITRIANPALISATETIACRYSNTAGTALSASGASNIIPFATKAFDTHGAFVTDTFTAPTAGKYNVSAKITTAAYGATTGGTYAELQKNGSNYSRSYVTGKESTTSVPMVAQIDDVVDLVAGDTLKINFVIDVASTTSLNTAVGSNVIAIRRVGL